MAHHHRGSNRPHDEGKEFGDVKVESTGATTPNLNHSPHEKRKGDFSPHEKRKSIFEYEIAGFPWPMVALMSVMVTAVLVAILKAMGVF